MKPVKIIKRRDAAKSREKILKAAQIAFSERGYAQTGIRDIAAQADVSSTLLLRYYGSKAGLFEAALIDATRSDELLAGGKAGFGDKLAVLFLGTTVAIRPPTMIALSTSDEEAKEITTRVTQEHVLKPLAKWLGPPDANVRALEIFMLCTSFVLYTQQLPLATSKASRQKFAQWFAQSVQTIIDQS